jgi:Rrf2 family protein
MVIAMKLITRNTDYAIRALCFISKNDNRVISVGELAKRLKTPRPFLRKILQILNREGVLKSYKGKSGGFLLARPTCKIFVTDLIGIFQGPLRLDNCILAKMLCPEMKRCLLRRKIKEIESYILRELRNITIDSLLEKEARDGHKRR